MQQIAMKNAQSFELLYERYSTRMFRYFYRMLWQDEALANDYLQDLFLKIIEKPHLFNPKKVFSTWIFSVANNMCKNAYRDKKTIENIDNQLFTYQENFDEKIDFDLHTAQLQVAINELSAEHRECFILRYFEELSVKEIADITQSAEGTVKSRLHYGLRKVTKTLTSPKSSPKERTS